MTKPADFIFKLYEILEETSNRPIICWHNDEIVVKNTEEFVKKILPSYYRHSKLPSFIRQLNLYGFRKIKRNSDKERLFFKHDLFKQGCKQLLPQITLKQKNKSEQDEIKKQDVKELTQRRNEQLVNLRSNFKSVIQTIYQQIRGISPPSDQRTKQSIFLLKMCGARDQQQCYSFPQFISQPSVTNFLTKHNFDLL